MTRRGVSFRWLAARYAWIIALREAIRASGWRNRDETVGAVVLLGLAMSVPTLAAYALWILTGRHLFRYWFRPDVVFVDPFARIPPPLFTASSPDSGAPSDRARP